MRVKGRAEGISGQGAAWLDHPRREPEGDPGTTSYLSVSVLDAGIHQDHNEDGNGHPKISDHPPDLPGETCSALGTPLPLSLRRRVLPPAPFAEGLPQNLSPPTHIWDPRRRATHPAGEEAAVLELAQEEGDEESAGHQHQ